jgi:hypothetical protein
MLRDTQTAVIRQKCMEANPRIITRMRQLVAYANDVTGPTKARPVRLIDVLELFGSGKSGGPGFRTVRHAYHQVCVLWKLESDFLTHQSEECVEFIYSQLTRQITCLSDPNYEGGKALQGLRPS